MCTAPAIPLVYSSNCEFVFCFNGFRLDFLTTSFENRAYPQATFILLPLLNR